MKDLEQKTAEEKPKPLTGKNILFDPLGLKSSNLFKKIAAVQNNPSSDEDENGFNKVEEDKPIPIKPVVVANTYEQIEASKIFLPKLQSEKTKELDDSFSKNKPTNIVKNSTSDGLFDEIVVDNAFVESTLKSVQKVKENLR